MKILCDVPDEVIKLWRNNPQAGRKTFQDNLKCTEKEARFYSKLFKTGCLVDTAPVNTKPESGKTMKAGLLSDVHAPYHDQRALDAAVNYLLKVGVDMVVFTGDVFDNYKISKWNKNPLNPTFFKEVAAARQVVEMTQWSFPESTIWKILEGNHEIRLRSYIWSSAPELAGFDCISIESLFGLRELGIEYVSNMQLIQNDLVPFHLGNCYIFHGHEVPMSGGAVNFAKLHYDKNPINQICGHHHQEQKHTIRKLNRKLDGSWVLGCLCNLHPDFRPANQWNHGFGLIEWDADDMFAVTMKSIDNGRVL